MKNILTLAFSTLLLCSQVLAWGNTCSSCANNQNLLKVATWSVDQSPGFTTNNAARLQGSLDFLAGSEVAALNLNLVCLQEVYNNTDRQAIINRVSGALPYSFSAPAGNQPDCDINTNAQCNLFNGNSGTLILSSLPIQASQVLNFQSQANVNSNALWVRVLWNGTPVNFFCTDLLPDDYINSGVNYESLNLAQTQELLNYINTNVNNNEPVVLAGDFNSGPAVSNNAGVFVNNYNAILGAGYQNALTTLVPAADVPCISCNVNGQNAVTSHIFIKTNTNPAGCLASVGVFGTNTTVTTSEGVVATSDTVGLWTGICYGTTTAPPSPAPIQTAIVVQPVQIVSSGATVLPFLAVIAAILAFVF